MINIKFAFLNGNWNLVYYVFLEKSINQNLMILDDLGFILATSN
jgi:hypothetical protein